ncbi:hypothetical protein PIB30_077517, partial [Stylosanthes scabra]|nr:hypothetical protein [Stylosanthes scabra]
YLNLDHPTVPNWLWVNEVMFTEFGVRVPFTDFQQRLLNRASVAPSQLHPNAWSAIRCVELVTDSLRLPQDPETFLYLFTLFSPNTEGKTKKGYMSVRPGKHRKIFGLYEDSFHDFKGRFFKIFPGLTADQKDTADILVKLFSERNLKPKTVLSNPSEAREAIVDMAGKEVTLERLRRLIRPGSSQSVPAISIPAPGPSRAPVERQLVPADDNVVLPEGGFEQRRWCGEDVLKDYDPMESIRWAEWASLRSATIMKSIEPRLMAADQWEVLEKERAEEAERWKNRESELEGGIQGLRESVSDEKARADKAEASLAELEKSQDEVVRMAEDSVMATERALKDQISLLLPSFDVSQLGAFKAIVDGNIVDLPE